MSNRLYRGCSVFWPWALCGLWSFPSFAAVAPGPPPACALSASLHRVTVAEAAQILVPVAWSSPFAISDQVVQNKRLLDLYLCGSTSSFRSQLSDALSLDSVAISYRDGFVSVVVPPPARVPVLPPDVVVYRPRFRSASVLAELISEFSGAAGLPSSSPSLSFSSSDSSESSPSSSSQSGSAGSSAAPTQASGQAEDELLLSVPPGRSAAVLAALKEVDTPERSVSVRAAVFETGKSASRQSFFAGIISALGSAFSVSGATSAISLGSTGAVVKLGSGSIQAAVQALSQSGAYRIVTDPTLSVVSGSAASFSVGAQVPTLGTTSYEGASGQPVQSVTYVQTGINLQVVPLVLTSGISVALSESISAPETTTTGVDSTPTLTSRAISTSMFLQDRQLVLIGGVLQSDNSGDHTGLSFVPVPLGSDSSATDVQVAVLLEVDLLPVGFSQ